MEGTDFNLFFTFVPSDEVHAWVAQSLLLLLQWRNRSNLLLLQHWLLHLHKWLLMDLLLLLIVRGRSNILLLLLILELLLLLLWHHLSGFDGRPIIMLMVKAIVLHLPLLLQGKLVKRLLLLLLLLLGHRLHDRLRLFKCWERPYIAEITVDVYDGSGDGSLGLLNDLALRRHMIMDLLLDWLSNHLRLWLHHALWLLDEIWLGLTRLFDHLIWLLELKLKLLWPWQKRLIKFHRSNMHWSNLSRLLASKRHLAPDLRLLLSLSLHRIV